MDHIGISGGQKGVIFDKNVIFRLILRKIATYSAEIQADRHCGMPDITFDIFQAFSMFVLSLCGISGAKRGSFCVKKAFFRPFLSLNGQINGYKLFFSANKHEKHISSYI